MHILVTADTLGGVWTYTRELVTGLVRGGDSVTLVSFGDIPAPDQMRWMEGLPNLDYRPTAFKLEWMMDSEADMRASAQLLEALIQECRPDLLHLNQFYYGALRSDVPRIVVAHSDVVSWWHSVHHAAPPESDWLRWYRRIVEHGLSEATVVVAPSRWMLEQVKHFYRKPELSSVIYNGRTPTLFHPDISKKDTILTVGRVWDGGKNAGLLLRHKMPVPVYIVGSDRHPDSLSSAFLAEEIRPEIHLEPHQDERQLALTMARAGIYAATSQYEPFGLAPVEAALSRCAIVASDIPSFRELWDGVAVFFRNNDADSLRETLNNLVRDPEWRRKQANLAYRHALQKFTAERMVAGYRNLYHSLVPAQALTA